MKEAKSTASSALSVEDGIRELLDSPSLQPYMDYYEVELAGRDTAESLHRLSELPLKQRYIWRVGSALKWALGDLDTETVRLDLRTMSTEDANEMHELLKLRPMQFIRFISTVYEAEYIRDVMLRMLPAD